MEKRIKIILICFAALIAAVLMSFIPTLNLKVAGMKELSKEHFTVYYEEQDKDAAIDISNRLQKGYDVISKSTNLSPQYKTKIYIYTSLKEFHMKKYGLWGLIIAPDWYIGDNIKDKVIITSPNSPGKQNNYESVANAALHEYVHTLMWNINPKLSKFLNEGMAGYVSGNTKPTYKFSTVPSYEDTKITDSVSFGNRGMYEISYTYIEFLDRTYGMEKIIKLITDNDYKDTVGKSEKDLYEEWIKFLKVNYI